MYPYIHMYYMYTKEKNNKYSWTRYNLQEISKSANKSKQNKFTIRNAFAYMYGMYVHILW